MGGETSTSATLTGVSGFRGVGLYGHSWRLSMPDQILTCRILGSSFGFTEKTRETEKPMTTQQKPRVVEYCGKIHAAGDDTRRGNGRVWYLPICGTRGRQSYPWPIEDQTRPVTCVKCIAKLAS
jgi:hypothetical protein